MKRKLTTSFVCVLLVSLFISSTSNSQVKKQYNLFTSSDNSSLLNNELKNVVSDVEIFELNREELNILCNNRNPEISFQIPYKNNVYNVNLERFDVLAPNAKIVTRTAQGNQEITLDDIAVSYRGKLEGFDNTMITVTFSRDNVVGLMISGNDNFVIGQVKNKQGQETGKYALYKESDLIAKNSFNCFADDNLSASQIENVKKAIGNQLNDATPTDLYVAEIAIEVDYATYNIYQQSVQTATNYAISVISAVSSVYMREVNVKLVIPYLRVWATPDPYVGTTSSSILNQFRAEWNANQQAVPRTLAHMISRRAGNLGGIAWVGALCSSTSGGFGYAFSNTDGPIQPLPTYSWDVMVVAHETGHNFGSPHTHSCSWNGGPIDSCYQTEGGCYTGPAIARVGTIMSYCHLNGSISLDDGFGPMPREVLRNGAESAGCMYVSNRPVAVGYPNGGESFRTGNNTVIYWGTSLTGNVNIELSTNNGSTWQTVQSNLPATQRTYDWTIPAVSSTQQARIRILDSSNPNVGDTCDAGFKIILNLNAFNDLSPASLTRIEVAPNMTGTQKFVWSSAGTNNSITYKLKFRKLGSTVDYTYTSDNNGSDTAITFRKSFLDTLAQTLGTTGDSVRCSWRGWAYNGIDSSSTANSFLVTFVRTTVGINVISSVVPDEYSLGNNYPNPFNPSTKINFSIPNTGNVELNVYDSKGSLVSRLVNQKLNAGVYEYEFNAVNLPSGAYFYRLNAENFVQTKRMVLVK